MSSSAMVVLLFHFKIAESGLLKVLIVFRDWHVSVLSFDNCSGVLISNSTFEWIIADAKTLSVHSSNIIIMNSSFEHNNGSLSADDKSNVYITGSVFFNNTGGAIYCAYNSLIYLKENNFSLIQWLCD